MAGFDAFSFQFYQWIPAFAGMTENLTMFLFTVHCSPFTVHYSLIQNSCGKKRFFLANAVCVRYRSQLSVWKYFKFPSQKTAVKQNHSTDWMQRICIKMQDDFSNRP
jgi:hypothetical protein